MRISLAYGSDGLVVELPDAGTTVIEPVHQQAAADPVLTLRTALRQPVAGPPLRSLAKAGQTVAISVCDITRAQPRQLMLEAILDELAGIIRLDDVRVLIATGTHRASTPAELLSMLGPRVLGTCQVIDHAARDRDSLVDLGMVGDVPVLLNRAWVSADLRITTGFVEPHFFAGFSGGPKMVAPGLAGIDTTLELHNARRIGDPRATWGICEGNPVHDAVRAIAAVTGVGFSLDVLLDREQRITRAFGGPVLEMHARARAMARQEAMRAVPGRFDIVITTNSGFPLDQNLYQSIKGISAAAEIVRDGGTIICAAECRDGLPDHGNYAQLLASRATPAELLAAINASSVTIPDQWQVQVQARIQARARVMVHADGLDDSQLAAAHLEPVADIGALVARLVRDRPGSTIGVLPEGPQTIAYVAERVRPADAG